MEAIGIQADWSGFDRAIVDYASISSKTFADVLNKKMGDVCFRAAQLSIQADKSKIKSLPKDKEWWPKFIQKVINQGHTIHTRVRIKKKDYEKAMVSWRDPATGKIRYGRKTMGVDRNASKSHKDAVRVSAAIIRRRAATAGMFRAIFSIAALGFGKLASKVERKGRNWLTVKKATPHNKEASFEVPFNNNKKSWPGGTRPSASADVRKKESLGYKFLQRGIDYVSQEMDEYANIRMQRDADKVSAK